LILTPVPSLDRSRGAALGHGCPATGGGESVPGTAAARVSDGNAHVRAFAARPPPNSVCRAGGTAAPASTLPFELAFGCIILLTVYADTSNDECL
jgi:hypothetical protein